MPKIYQYTAWIPTNSGFLSAEHVLTPEWIEDSSNSNKFFLKNKNLYATDSISEEYVNQQTIYTVTSEIDFSKKEYWYFKIDIYDQDLHVIKASGLIDKSGKTSFNVSSVHEKLLIGDLENIPNTIFTFLKQLIHKDLHHLEKVDNVIPICDNEDEWHIKTANRLAKKIKTLEFDAKRIYRDGLAWDKFKLIESIYWDAKGFKAYYDAFMKHNLYKQEDKRYLNPLPVIQSLEAMQGKINSSRQRRMTLSTIIGTVVALFISLNIMTQNPFFHASEQYEYQVFLGVVFVIVFIFEIMMHLHFGANLLTRLWDPTYESKEYYQRLYLASHTNNKDYINKLKNFPVQTKALLFFLNYGWAVVAVGAFISFVLFVKALFS